MLPFEGDDKSESAHSQNYDPIEHDILRKETEKAMLNNHHNKKQQSRLRTQKNNVQANYMTKRIAQGMSRDNGSAQNINAKHLVR